MGFQLSGDGGTVDLTDMGIQSYVIRDPVMLEEIELLDDKWELQPRGSKATVYEFAGNIPAEPKQKAKAEPLLKALIASKLKEWTLSVTTGRTSSPVGPGYIDGEIVQTADKGLLAGEPLELDWSFSLKLKAP